ncbi:MAG TPA: SAM-dependent methyltransferase, partial [Streptosporangiaceae bacterium]
MPAERRRSGESLGRDSRTSPCPDHPRCVRSFTAPIRRYEDHELVQDTSEALEEALRQYEASGAVPYRTRSLEEFTGYFDGLELVEPGVVLVADWRPNSGA